MENRSRDPGTTVEAPRDLELAPTVAHFDEDFDSGRQNFENPKFQLLWDSRRALLRSALAGLIVAVIVAFLIPVQFESSTRLMPPDQAGSAGVALLSALSSKAGEGLGLASDLLGAKSTGAQFVGILRSRTVLNDLVKQFDLRKVYWVKHWEDARNKLESRTSISEDRKSGIITITVTDHDPQRSAALAQAYVDDLNRLVALLTTSAAHRERVFLEQRLQSVKSDLDSAAVEFSQFSSKNTAIDVPEQGKAMVQSAAQLQGELIASQSELSGLEQIYSSNNVRIRSVRAKINELQRQLNNVAGAPGKDGSGDGETLYPSIRELPLLGVKYFDLYRKLKVQENVFEALTKQYEVAKVQEAKEIPTVRVLDSANVPERKSFPPRTLIALLGALLGLLGAILWRLWAAFWSDLNPADPRKALAHAIFERSHLRGLRIVAETKSRGSPRSR